jgi:2-polyprenyl-3-methyl-5-hydroxy-6-metoxy-1,4-benzoquinol methylase
LHYLSKTGNRRFEFERLYLEHQDPWNYRDSLYEQEKYQRTLSCALNWRRRAGAALEVGCSIGAFSRLVAAHFDKVTAIDVSKEALRTAAEHNCGFDNIRFVHGDLRFVDLGPDQYNVIFCAEVLYYIRKKDASEVCRQLDRYLAADGVIIMVTGVSPGKHDEFYFEGWEQILCAHFSRAFKEVVQDPRRPYRIIVIARQ